MPIPAKRGHTTMRLLFIVSDFFAITGRGLVVEPAPLIEDFPGPKTIEVELRRPDGSTTSANLSFELVFRKGSMNRRLVAAS